MNNVTLILSNLTRENLTVRLCTRNSVSKLSARANGMDTTVSIPRGKAIDVCKHLGVTMEEAWEVVERSPDVKRWRRCWPPKLHLEPVGVIDQEGLILAK